MAKNNGQVRVQERITKGEARQAKAYYIYINRRRNRYVFSQLSLRACLHGGGVPQVGEITRLGWVLPGIQYFENRNLPVHIISHMVTPPIM